MKQGRALPRVPRRIGLVGHAGYTALHPIVQRVSDFAGEHGLELFFEAKLLDQAGHGQELRAEDVPTLDFLLTLGGDGTLLRGARMAAPHAIPVLGINLGHLGFLTALAPADLEPGLEALLAGEATIDERMVLDARAVAADGTVHAESFALNDAVLHRGGVARMIRMVVHAHGEEVGTYSADGIILATPSGSTAYSLSAGGPIVSPAVDCILATPISPHTLAIRPLILSAAETVTVEVLSPSEELILTIDGQEGAVLVPGDRLVVARAPIRLLLIRFPGQTFFSTLRRKLRWGDVRPSDQ